MGYSSVAEVLKAAGFGLTTTRIAAIEEGQLVDADITSMIEDIIEENDDEIDGKLYVPKIIRDELHIADGETDTFLIGPTDEGDASHYDVENCLVEVLHCYFDCYKEEFRKLRPYPIDCDSEFTEGVTAVGNWNTTVSNCTATKETTIIKCGDDSIKMVFSASGYSRFILSASKNIDQYEYFAFAVYSSLTTPTFTVNLWNEDSEYDTQTFTVKRSACWYVIWVRIDNMTHGSGTPDWDNDKLYIVEIKANAACTIYLDMLNFNDGYCWSAPQGYLYIHNAANAGEEEPVADKHFFVTYRYNPYLVSAPAVLRKASKLFAAADLIDHLIGLRLSHTEFILEGSSAVPSGDKDVQIFNPDRLRRQAEEALANGIGYGFDFRPIRG